MICVLTKKDFAHRDKCFQVQDYSATIENMLLAIVCLGYQSCWYEGHITDDDKICDKIAAILDVPEDYTLVCVLPVGIATEEIKTPKKKTLKKEHGLTVSKANKFSINNSLITLDKVSKWSLYYNHKVSTCSQIKF